jgi:hypothetical protein
MPPTTRIILDTFTDAAVQGRIGRQLPRLFALAGLTGMSVTPTVILSNAAFWRILYQDHVARLQDQLRSARDFAREEWPPSGAVRLMS